MDESTHHRSSLITFLALAFACVAALLWMCAPYIVPILMGEILALLLVPIHRRLRRRLPEKLSSAVATLGLLVLVIAPIAWFVTVSAKQGADVARQIMEDGTVIEKAQGLFERAGRFAGDPAALKRQATQALQQGAKGASLLLLGIAGAIPGAALELTLALLSCFFFLLDEGRLPRHILSRLPLDEDLRVELFDTIRATSVSTIWAGFVAAVAQSSAVLLGFWILGMPALALAAGATFLCAWVPMLGIMPVSVAGGAYLLAQGDYGRLVGLAVVVVVAGLVDNFARPLMLKSGRGLHPILSLVAIFGGVKLFGIVGLFLGPVLAAVVVALYDVWPSIAKRYGLEVEPETDRPSIS